MIWLFTGRGCVSFLFFVKYLETTSYLMLEAPSSCMWSLPKARRGYLLSWRGCSWIGWAPKKAALPLQSPYSLLVLAAMRVLSVGPLPQIPTITCLLSKSFHSLQRDYLFLHSQVQGNVRGNPRTIPAGRLPDKESTGC